MVNLHYAKQFPDLDSYITQNQIEILEYNQWYVIDGQFDADRVLSGWCSGKDKIASRFCGFAVNGEYILV